MRFMLVGILSASLFTSGCGVNMMEADDISTDNGIRDHSQEMDYTITGVELGAGQTEVINHAIETYDSLDGWEQKTSSYAAMLAELDEAFENEAPIAIAAWSPHYKFSQYDLKYLEDTEGIFGEDETVRTIARTELEEDLPHAYAILDRIQFETGMIEEAVRQGADSNAPYTEIAREWVDENAGTVEEWTTGIAPGEGEPVKLVTTHWDDSLFTANVAAVVLSEHGFDVTLSAVDTLALFETIAAGDADASLSPWLPVTDGIYYDEYADQIDDLGPHTEGARIGIAVPEYMDIDSIEELNPKE